jgi:hypothetical protein
MEAGDLIRLPLSVLDRGDLPIYRDVMRTGMAVE